MGVFALTDAGIYVGGYDFSGDTNKVAFSLKATELDSTTFGNTYHKRIGGLLDTSLAADGLWQSAAAAAPDPQVFPTLRTMDQVATLLPTTTVSSVAYMAQFGTFAYDIGAGVGEIAPFTLDAAGSNAVGVVRGRLTAAKQTVSATGAIGTGQNLGAVGATQYLYGTVHIFSVGTTITLVLESDDNSGFTTPTTVQTIGPLTTTGGTWVTRTAGALTDSWFRYRVTAVTGSFQLAAAIGIR